MNRTWSIGRAAGCGAGRVAICGALLCGLLSAATPGRPQQPAGTAASGASPQSTPPIPAQSTPGILQRNEAEKIFPATVFFQGQTATTEGRNSAGIRLPGGALVLVALVDASGYSSGVAERYQGYLLTEVALNVGGKNLPAGAYGFGFVPNDRVVVMDLGGHDVLMAGTVRNPAMRRPEPLQIVAEAGETRLYLGRSYVTLTPAVTARPEPGR